MSDDTKDDKPSMRASLGLVIDNDPRHKSIRRDTDDLDKLTRALTGEGMSLGSLGDEYERDDDEPLLEEAVLVMVEKPSVVPNYAESDVSEDYRFSRSMLYTLIQEAGSALAAANRLAKQSQHPRAFEIVNNLTNTLRDLSKDLMVLQKAFNEITAGKEDKKLIGNAPQAGAVPEPPKLTGTTGDILRLVREAQGNDQ